MKYHLRQALESDYNFLKQLHHTTLREYISQIWGWDEKVQDEQFDKQFDPAKTRIIQVDNEDVGCLALKQGNEAVFISSLLIAIEEQGRGIGSAVINDVVEEAFRQQKAVTLTVLKPNPARRLYERLGFVVTHQDEQRYYMRIESVN